MAEKARLANAGSADTNHYRPQLDGVRAVAVYLVVAFHAGLNRFAGGFIGVDIFFVLSGYLVTQLLMRDIQGAQGRIGFARFYSRRFRRLLPASLIVLLVTAATFATVAAPAEAIEGLRSVKAAFLYVANWFFIRDSNDYFGGDINASPVVHFWSLSIEEQFYALWPLLLAGLVLVTRWARRAQWHVIRIVVAVAAVASLIAALRLADTDLNRAYYGTDTRAYQLLAGALLAMTPHVQVFAQRRARELRGVAVVMLAALIVLGTSLVDVGPITRGAITTFATCVLVVALEGARDGVVVRWLSSAPLVYLGEVSYGTYLWHWPVIVVMARLIDVSPVPRFLVAAAFATGLASLSYQLLERPVRVSPRLDRYRAPVIAVGLALSVIGAFVLAPAIVDGEQPKRAAVGTIDSRSTPGAVDPSTLPWQAALDDWETQPQCLEAPVSKCIGVTGRAQRLLLIGDSNAVMLYPALEAIAQRRGLTLAVAARDSCPWQRGLLFADFRRQEVCAAHQTDTYDRILPEFDPDVVVLMDRTFEDPNSRAALTIDDRRIEPGSAEFVPLVRRATMQSLKTLRRDGRRIVMIEPTPFSPKKPSPNVCLSTAKTVDECRFVASPGPMGVERMYREVADEGDDVWALDLDRLVCPYLPICDPVIDGAIVRVDQGHITATYSRKISRTIEQSLEANTILAPKG
ncbi:MAG: acyltransferase family protein [Acidimicrobiia bacterium]